MNTINNTVLSSMDRISGFEPDGVGSIPAGPANLSVVQWIERLSPKE